MDAANLRGHLDLTMPKLNGFSDRSPPADVNPDHTLIVFRRRASPQKASPIIKFVHLNWDRLHISGKPQQECGRPGKYKTCRSEIILHGRTVIPEGTEPQWGDHPI
jgi:hypothetical protein